jgi:hypothetical protein
MKLPELRQNGEIRENRRNKDPSMAGILLRILIARDLRDMLLRLTISILCRIFGLESLKIPCIRTPLYQKQNAKEP